MKCFRIHGEDVEWHTLIKCSLRVQSRLLSVVDVENKKKITFLLLLMLACPPRSKYFIKSIFLCKSKSPKNNKLFLHTQKSILPRRCDFALTLLN